MAVNKKKISRRLTCLKTVKVPCENRHFFFFFFPKREKEGRKEGLRHRYIHTFLQIAFSIDTFDYLIFRLGGCSSVVTMEFPIVFLIGYDKHLFIESLILTG